MELQAVISGLQALERPAALTVHIDSSYVMDAIVKRWHVGWVKRGWQTAAKQPVKNRELWEELLALVALHTVTWHKVKGHAGVALNERCDELAVAACHAARPAARPLMEARGKSHARVVPAARRSSGDRCRRYRGSTRPRGTTRSAAPGRSSRSASAAIDCRDDDVVRER